MSRFHVSTDAATGAVTQTPYTAEEEAAADLAAAAAAFQDLNRIQFEFMVEKLGIGPAIEAAIAQMPDDTETEQNAKILARVLYRSGQDFKRGHPLFTELAPAVGFTSEQIDAAWLAALTI